MKLIGMLDSPYVRRVAISLQYLGVAFEHESLSVFRGFDAFRRINPVVKAPTLVCDDGTVLMDSTLILEYAEALVRPRSLMPEALDALARDLRLLGLALAAGEKSVQIVYERELRPAEKQHETWLARVSGQMLAGFSELELELERAPIALGRGSISQAAITSAVMFYFARQKTDDFLAQGRFPQLEALSAEAEALPQFRAAPYGGGTYPVAAEV